MRTIFRFLFLFFIFFNLAAIVLVGAFIYAVHMPFASENAGLETVIIEQGMSVRSIGTLLEEERIIRSANFFIVQAVLDKKASALQAGVYELSPALSTVQIISIMSGGSRPEVTVVTIPEGFTAQQIEERLLEAGLSFSAGAFVEAVEERELEGYLFPDTYEFRLDAGIDNILEKFSINFERKTQHLFLQKGAGQAQNFSDHEIIVLASLIEREVQTEEDMRIVSGILHNRLEIGMALQVDATLVYLTGKKTGQITNQDKLIDSPFNTYKYRGLPPAPIANPGLQAITAAPNPTPTKYFYYLSAPDGTTYFAETLEGHNVNKARYLR